jgi:hypothetical protein
LLKAATVAFMEESLENPCMVPVTIGNAASVPFLRFLTHDSTGIRTLSYKVLVDAMNAPPRLDALGETEVEVVDDVGARELLLDGDVDDVAAPAGTLRVRPSSLRVAVAVSRLLSTITMSTL